MGFFNFGRVIAAATLAVAMSAAGVGAARAASELQVVMRSETGAATLSGFNPTTGDILSALALTNGGYGVSFARVGSMFYAPDGVLQAIIETGTGSAALVGFNPQTGSVLGGFELTSGGAGFEFGRLGAALYAPNGELQALIEAGDGSTALVGFNPTNGGLLGGVHLTNNGADIDFGRLGAALYAPNGDFQVILETGANAAALVAFNPTTGGALGGVGLAQNGSGIGFGRIGGALYAPNGDFQVILETGADTAALVAFNTTTGEILGGAGLTGASGGVPFADVGAVLYAPGGDLPSAVPEPATWAMMICGFGAAGATLRSRRFSARRWAAAHTPGETPG